MNSKLDKIKIEHNILPEIFITYRYKTCQQNSSFKITVRFELCEGFL